MLLLFSSTLIIFMLTISAAENPATPTAPNSLADLQALVKERDWKAAVEESLRHSPSLRTQEWVELTQKSWKNLFQEWLDPKQILQTSQINLLKIFFEHRRLKSLSELKGPALEVGHRYLEQCWGKQPLEKSLEQFKTCAQDFSLLWNEAQGQHPKTLTKLWILIDQTANTIEKGIQQLVSDTALKESQQYLLALSAPQGQWFQRALLLAQEFMLTPGTEQLCGTPQFLPWQWEILKNFVLKLKEYQKDQFPILMAKHMTWNCWQQTRAVFLNNLQEYQGDDRQLLLYLLGADQSLPPLQQRLVLFLYLLEKPLPSSQFNYAWKSLEELGEKKQDRDWLLDHIKSWSLLPDLFLIDQQLVRRNSIVELILINFPEWFKEYEQRCLDYLHQKQSFPKGNPTANCKIYCGILKSKTQWQLRSAKFKELEKELKQLCQ